MNHKAIRVAPSMLSCDFARMAEQAAALEAAGADVLHLDVMDGAFVPNITFGPCVIRSLRKATRLPLDVHMMVDHPERYIRDMADAGADFITVHVEATEHIHRALQMINALEHVTAGVAINPGTPVSSLECIAGDVGLVLVMTVNPGFGGQKLIRPALEKIAQVRRMLDGIGSDAEIEVDGGVSAANAREFTDRGATLLVSGTGVFGAPDWKEAIAAMKR